MNADASSSAASLILAECINGPPDVSLIDDGKRRPRALENSIPP
jgi:hypothetical protein